MSQLRPIHLYSAACIVGVLVGSGLAVGQLRASRGALNACVGSDGVMHLSSGTRCPSGQRLVTWNTTGPEGAAGARGPVGPAGPVSTINNMDLNALPFIKKDRFLRGGAPSSSTSTYATSGTGDCMIGEVRFFGGNFAPRGWAVAAGQTVPIASNQALFSVLGTTYGGDGRTSFALPDLSDIQPDGAYPIICMQGSFPARN